MFTINEDNGLEELEKLMEEEIKAVHQVKRTKPRASVPFLVEVIAYKSPPSWVSKEDDEMTSDEQEVTSRVTKPVVKEEEDAMECKEETKGTKRKLEEEVKVKKENSKKAYKRRVQAYKRRFKEQKILVEDSSKDST